MTERSERCRHVQGALAMRALGRPDDLDAALDDHLATCADCRAELADLTDAADAAMHADPATPIDDTLPPLDLPVRILGQVGAETARRRRRRVLAAAAVIVFLLAGAGFMVARHGGPATEAAIPLTGPEGTSGSATLVAHDWGTEIGLTAEGLHDGEVYWLWLTDAGGERVGAGTVTGTGGSMRAVLASALPAADARRIWLTDADDTVVLDAFIAE